MPKPEDRVRGGATRLLLVLIFLGGEASMMVWYHTEGKKKLNVTVRNSHAERLWWIEKSDSVIQRKKTHKLEGIVNEPEL